MKKILCLSLALLMMVTAVLVTGCAKKEEPLKLGVGVYAYYEAIKNPTDEKNGSGQAVATVAAVLLDANGKIVKCEIDAVDNTVEFTAEGKFVPVESFQTKYEKGDSYNMVAYGGAKSEWYVQADAFEKLTLGKTINEVKALEADGGLGNTDVIAAGCTISVSDFVKALDKAVANAVDSKAVESNTLKLGIVTEMSGEDAKAATADAEAKAGSIELETSIAAAAVDADGKVTAIKNDCLSVKFEFDAAGVASTKKETALKTKGELGKDYNMVAYGGAKKEWFEQANAFDDTCLGKTAAEIAGLETNGKSGDALISAGCTISASNMIKATQKATKVG